MKDNTNNITEYVRQLIEQSTYRVPKIPSIFDIIHTKLQYAGVVAAREVMSAEVVNTNKAIQAEPTTHCTVFMATIVRPANR